MSLRSSIIVLGLALLMGQVSSENLTFANGVTKHNGSSESAEVESLQKEVASMKAENAQLTARVVQAEARMATAEERLAKLEANLSAKPTKKKAKKQGERAQSNDCRSSSWHDIYERPMPIPSLGRVF